MKSLGVSNIEVGGSRHGEEYSLSCEFEGNRYHVWVNKSTHEVKEPLYKNPPQDLKHGAPGYFNTRKLDLDGAMGRKLVPAMLAARNEQGLVQKWLDRLAAEEAQSAETRKKAAVEQSVKERTAVAAQNFSDKIKSGEWTLAHAHGVLVAPDANKLDLFQIAGLAQAIAFHQCSEV